MRDRVLDVIVTLLAGFIGGMLLAAAIMSHPKKAEIKCNDGRSEQIKDGVKIKTYVPALDTCRESK